MMDNLRLTRAKNGGWVVTHPTNGSTLAAVSDTAALLAWLGENIDTTSSVPA